MKIIMILVMLAAFAIVVANARGASERPNVEDAPLFARWLVSQGSRGILATLNVSIPFGYVASYSDAGTGFPYFFLSPTLDPAGKDAINDPTACFTLTELSIGGCKGADPQSPSCAKISLTGNLVMLGGKTKEAKMAQKALFKRHPQFSGFPKQNGSFAVFKLDIQSIFLVNKPAKAAALTVEEYLNLEY